MDRNDRKFREYKHKSKVVPYVGTWIEMRRRGRVRSCTGSRSLRGNVDRNSRVADRVEDIGCRSLRGNVDRNVAVGRR